MPTITALLTGRVAPLGPRAAPSGIDKRPVDGPRLIHPAGIAGDEQGDLRNHGGVDKAVHHYPAEHYPAWRAELGERPILATVGAFGENISTSGMTEASVAVGDVFRIGSALVQVSQGRQPCWKLNARFDVPEMSRRVQSSGRTGWYYRVIEAGQAAPGDALTLVDRPAAAWTIERLWRLFYVDPLDRDALRQVADLMVLAEGWRAYAAKRVASGKVEDWSRRLDGEA